MRRNPNVEREMLRAVRLICASEQPDMIEAAFVFLKGFANGSAALRYVRLGATAAQEATNEFLLKASVKRKVGTKR